MAPSRETAGELLLGETLLCHVLYFAGGGSFLFGTLADSCCLTGKSGMYFVEDNAADAHDSQVKDCFSESE